MNILKGPSVQFIDTGIVYGKQLRKVTTRVLYGSRYALVHFANPAVCTEQDTAREKWYTTIFARENFAVAV